MSEPALPGREARGPSARSVTIRSYACPITLDSIRVPYYQREEKHSQDLRIHLETTIILSSAFSSPGPTQRIFHLVPIRAWSCARYSFRSTPHLVRLCKYALSR